MRFLGRFLLAVTLATSMAAPVSGQTVDQAFFQAGFRLTAAISSEGLSVGKKIGIVKFRDRIGVTSASDLSAGDDRNPGSGS